MTWNTIGKVSPFFENICRIENSRAKRFDTWNVLKIWDSMKLKRLEIRERKDSTRELEIF